MVPGPRTRPRVTGMILMSPAEDLAALALVPVHILAPNPMATSSDYDTHVCIYWRLCGCGCECGCADSHPAHVSTGDDPETRARSLPRSTTPTHPRLRSAQHRDSTYSPSLCLVVALQNRG